MIIIVLMPITLSYGVSSAAVAHARCTCMWDHHAAVRCMHDEGYWDVKADLVKCTLFVMPYFAVVYICLRHLMSPPFRHLQGCLNIEVHF